MCGVPAPHAPGAAELGRQLARMHLAEPQHEHAGRFGFFCDNTIGGTPQPNPWTDNWVEFFRCAAGVRVGVSWSHCSGCLVAGAARPGGTAAGSFCACPRPVSHSHLPVGSCPP